MTECIRKDLRRYLLNNREGKRSVSLSLGLFNLLTSPGVQVLPYPDPKLGSVRLRSRIINPILEDPSKNCHKRVSFLYNGLPRRRTIAKTSSR